MLSSVRAALEFMSGRQRAIYFTLVAARALAGLLDIVGVVLVGFLAGIGASQFAGPSSEPVVLFGFTLPSFSEGELLVLVLIVLAVFVVKAIIGLVLSRAIALFAARIEAQNAILIAEFFLRGTLSLAHRHSKAEVQYATTTSAGHAFTNILNSFATIISEGVLLVLVAGTFVVVDPIIAIVVMAYFGLVVGLIHFVISNRLKRSGSENAIGSIGSAAIINDSLDTFREISVLDKQDHFLDRFGSMRRRLARSTGMLSFLGGVPRYIVETALMLGVVVFVGWLFLTGSIASGLATLGVFLTGGVRIMGSLLPLQNALALIKSSSEHAKMSISLLRERRATYGPTPAAIREPAPLQEAEEIRTRPLDVVVDGLVFTHPGKEEPTLQDVSLRIDAGTHVAFIGPSGAGKTTLVDLLLGLTEPQTGSVRIGGLEPRQLRTAVPGLIAYVPQRPGLVSGSIAENIALGIDPEEIDHTRIAEVVQAAHLEEFIASLPEGTATSVGKQGNALSGGQIQRLGLARALYHGPRLLILDEATSALDAGSEAFISESLRELGSSATVIVVAHRLSTVQHSDVVHVLEGGRLTASGGFAELRREVPMVAEYVKLMSFDES